MNPNEHISENLRNYLTIEAPEYAFLISGDWGAGKTHYIDNFIASNPQEKTRIIKISLFSLASTKEINEKIFEAIYPFFANQKVKLAGKLLKGALSFGFKVDLNSDGKPDGTTNVKLDKLELFEKIYPGDSNKDLVLVLDDIERSSIPLKDTLGYINELTEILKVRVVLIANEKQFNEEEGEIYSRFKEKVIGKTFEISQDVESILDELLRVSVAVKLKAPKEICIKEEIKNIYEMADYRNLRKLKQTISDFSHFLQCLQKTYTQHPVFYKYLLRTFFALSLELKSGQLKEGDLEGDKPFSNSRGKDDGESIVFNKYFINSPHLYSGKIWAEILCKGKLNNINEATSKLVYFIENTSKKTKEDPAWVQLLDYEKLEENEFSELIRIVEQEIVQCTECDPRIYLHKISIAIYFSKLKLSSLSIPFITKATKRFVNEYKSSEAWLTTQLSGNTFSDGIGYIYLSAKDPSFIDLRKRLLAQSKDSFETGEQLRAKRAADALNEQFTNSDVKTLAKLLNKDNEYTPILAKLSPDDFIGRLEKSTNKDLQFISEMVSFRYRDNHTLNGRTFSQILHEEHKFWEAVSERLKSGQIKATSLKSHLLEMFNENKVIPIIKSLIKNAKTGSAY
jgi:hypothetical protein